MRNLINYLADVITDFCVENKIIPADERAIYKYGAEITISTLVGLFSILLVGVITGNIFESLMFLVCYVSVRIFAGGYHATTYYRF